MAEVVLRHRIAADPSLAGRVKVTSAGTARWHVGDDMDPRARQALDRGGFATAGSPAAYADTELLDSQDLVLVMTKEHRDTVLERLSNSETQVVLWRQLIDPSTSREVSDPYYGPDADFDECVSVFDRGADHLLPLLRDRLVGPEEEDGA
jgi:protein-tyrosine phosphatase